MSSTHWINDGYQCGNAWILEQVKTLFWFCRVLDAPPQNQLPDFPPTKIAQKIFDH